MADTLDEALSTATSATEDHILYIDDEFRTITVPDGLLVGARTDKDVHELKFEMPRYFHDLDLSTFDIQINYISDSQYTFNVTDKTVEDSVIDFTWLVGSTAFTQAGKVSFAVSLITSDTDGNLVKKFNTTIATLTVVETLDSGDITNSEYRALYKQLQELIGENVDVAKSSAKEATEAESAIRKMVSAPTTVTDPTSKTVLLAGSQGIDYSKLADAIIAKYQGQTLAGKAQSVKSALDTVRSVQDQTIKTEDSSTPCSYSAGDFFVYDGKLYKASADFSSVTLTADNISTYAEAQTQTAINALNQSLLSGVRIVEHWKYRPEYHIPVDGQLELDFSKYVRDERHHPYGDNFLIFANTDHHALALFGFISLVSSTMTSCRGIIEVGLKLSFTHNDDYSVQSIVIKNDSKYTSGIKDVYILRLS